MLPILLMLLAAPKSGTAPKLPQKAAVFVSSPDEGGAAKQEAELTKALEKSSVPLVNVGAEFPVPAPDDAGAKLVKEARQAYDDLDYEGSAAKWSAALEFFDKHAHTADSKTLADAHFYQGVLAIQNGGKAQSKKAQEEFVKALVHNPTLTCDAQVFGADVKKVFEKATTEVGNKAVGKISIESIPSGAEVVFRGHSLGTTPLTAGPTVTIGRHLLLFSKPGYEPVGAFAEVTREGALVKPDLKPAQGYAEVRDAATSLIGKSVGVKGGLANNAHKLAEIVKARFLIMSDGATVEGWDVETGNRVMGLSLSSEELSVTVKKLEQFVSKPGAPVAVAAAEPSKTGSGGTSGTVEQGAGEPVYKQWWFWTAVGVVAVGAGTGIGIAAANGGPRPFNVVLGTP